MILSYYSTNSPKLQKALSVSFDTLFIFKCSHFCLIHLAGSWPVVCRHLISFRGGNSKRLQTSDIKHKFTKFIALADCWVHRICSTARYVSSEPSAKCDGGRPGFRLTEKLKRFRNSCTFAKLMTAIIAICDAWYWCLNFQNRYRPI